MTDRMSEKAAHELTAAEVEAIWAAGAEEAMRRDQEREWIEAFDAE